MVNERYSMAISETLHYLKGINQKDIKKIPDKFMDFLKNNALQNYECKFDYTQSLNNLNLMDETRGLISMICLNFWCENEHQKNNFIKHLNINEKRYEEELRKKYNIDDIFNKKDHVERGQIAIENINKNILPIQAEKDNIFKRVWNWIIKIFYIKKD